MSIDLHSMNSFKRNNFCYHYLVRHDVMSPRYSTAHPYLGPSPSNLLRLYLGISHSHRVLSRAFWLAHISLSATRMVSGLSTTYVFDNCALSVFVCCCSFYTQIYLGKHPSHVIMAYTSRVLFHFALKNAKMAGSSATLYSLTASDVWKDFRSTLDTA